MFSLCFESSDRRDRSTAIAACAVRRGDQPRAHPRDRGEVLAGEPRASMAAVAKAANVSRATLYRHFPARADLLRAVGDHTRDAAVRTPRTGFGPPVRSRDRSRRRCRSPTCSTRCRRTCSETRSSPKPSGSPASARPRSISWISTVSCCAGWRVPRASPDGAGPVRRRHRDPAGGTARPRAAIEQHLPGAAAAPLVLRGRALGSARGRRLRRGGPAGSRVRGGGDPGALRRLHGRTGRRPPHARHQPRSRDPAEPPPAADRPDQRRADRGERPARLRDRRRLVRLRRERIRHLDRHRRCHRQRPASGGTGIRRARSVPLGAPPATIAAGSSS